MRVLLSDRTGEVPDRVRADLARRIAGLSRHLDLLAEAEIELGQEARRSERPLHVVDITLRMTAPNLQPIRAREAGRELDEAINLAVEKLDREILDVKEQLKEYPSRVGRREPRPSAPGSPGQSVSGPRHRR